MKYIFTGPNGSYQELERRLKLEEDETVEEVIFDENDDVMPKYQSLLNELKLRVTTKDTAEDYRPLSIWDC